ncbi:trypsin-like serine peptidase [Leptothoe sp. PORK10 BA2]|uniref:trypsin-like serine peptidase n=1 Tax=Leptothoe sp. PORK10 BA2 TaxID=3110254 RepID=UPI002B209EBF|nr:trypsin-like peptidase domain-containing protein [Leptothoe sp. PORK10 BA2]MEA5462504.1 trypsin-like peptidase domain-containing protein [Leptothoe sp. PORK10 BA2]
MLNRFIRKKFIALLLVTLLTILLGFNVPAMAQVPDGPGMIDLAFDAETDGATMLPEDITQSDAPYDDSRVVIGADERLPVLSREFPWVAMGRLEWQIQGEATSTCTATLIAPAAILTNSHCLILALQDESGELVDTFIEPADYSGLIQGNAAIGLKLIFKPGLIDGVSLDETEIIAYQTGWSTGHELPKDDWAVLSLAAPLGDYYGYMGWRDLNFEDPAVIDSTFESINLLGYAGDFPTETLQEWGQPTETAGVDQTCSILGVWPAGDELEETLIHDCDTNPGASGGPIFALFSDGNYYLVGLHARSTPLYETVTLPNGVDTDIVNGGVPVYRWQSAAFMAR